MIDLSLRTAAGRKQHLAVFFRSVATELGYGLEVPDPGVYGSPEGCWCYSRSDTPFQTSLLAVAYFARRRRLLSIDFVGSTLSYPALRQAGVSGNIIRETLHSYQLDQLNLPYGTVLPQAIELSTLEEWLSTLERLRQELVRVHPGVWLATWQQWQAYLEQHERPRA